MIEYSLPFLVVVFGHPAQTTAPFDYRSPGSAVWHCAMDESFGDSSGAGDQAIRGNVGLPKPNPNTYALHFVTYRLVSIGRLRLEKIRKFLRVQTVRRYTSYSGEERIAPVLLTDC